MGEAAAAGTESAADEVYSALTSFIEEEDFVCLGARAALRRDSIEHHHYGELGSAAAVTAQLKDLSTFLETFEPSARSFTSFVATFEGPGPLLTEEEFESVLWQHLQALHELDRTRYGWSEAYDSDPTSKNFAYSVKSHPFFVVGLHPGASRPSRRFSRPALVFNSHEQFNALGVNFFKLRMKIRKRERAFHGSANPSFLTYQEEARHYGGRMTEREWSCPFRAGDGPAAPA
ncbi:YqcI/YcgG family protein [Streptomyces sp. NBC_00247]|uniref:guanitoxin biosynthesis heme-dependent pre-guanitoxin N-hydroxylase GntA n=1 Tax=Streptomyces sp. NBC_00247 TaxID=2975689 RepID=UPI002E2E4D75|nr:guanitoxin biosynthesis heme-dependent pre-guanitoxin N-hydroxylase GntA [Streptomyces sp. NBC_00247]